MKIENCMIEGSKYPLYSSTNNYHDIDLSYLNYRYRHDNDDAFIHSKGITFKDKVGSLYVTGSELYCYPELATKLQKVADYPVLKRIYLLDKNIKGIDFVRYLAERVQEAYQDFQNLLSNANKQVDELFSLYGNKRYEPIITGYEKDHLQSNYLVISGIKWKLHQNQYKEYTDRLNTIDIYKLLDIICNDFECVRLETFIPNTPYLAVRLKKTWNHKGHVNWYDLNTRQKISKPNGEAATL